MHLEIRVYMIALATVVLLAASVVHAEESKSEAFELTRSQVIEKTMNRFFDSRNEMTAEIERSFLSDALKERYLNLLQTRFQRLQD